MAIKVFRVDRDYVRIPLVSGGGDARVVVGAPTGAKYRTMTYVVMKPGQENVMHRHAASEDVIFVLQGQGVVVDGDTGAERPYRKGSVIFIEQGTAHAVKSHGPEDYISMGGPCPPDTAMGRKADPAEGGGA